jgi:hypothetical protein
MNNDLHVSNAASDNVWNALAKAVPGLTDEQFNSIMELTHRDGTHCTDIGALLITLTLSGRGKYVLDIEFES